MAVRERPIFVVELPGAPSLAFEAANEAQAVVFAGAPWFTEALSDYLHAKKTRPRAPELGLHVRVATSEETLVYRKFANEFAEMAGSFLLAPVP